MRLTIWICLAVAVWFTLPRLAQSQPELSIICRTAQGKTIFTLDQEAWTMWRFAFDPPASWVGGQCRITY
jgi:hypothetical protein